jgi:crossover junction endodeoxyribonuclease RuvC
VTVLGIDPGLASTGYGVVSRRERRLVALDGGVIATSAELPLERRLAHIHAAVCALLEEHEPQAVALEELYFGQNVRTAFAVGQARGVVLLAAGQRGIACAGYTPQQVKGAVCGSGRAHKDQVARMVQSLLGLAEVPRPDHAADALAVAVCHANCAPMTAALANASAAALGARAASPSTLAHTASPNTLGHAASPNTLAHAASPSTLAHAASPSVRVRAATGATP